MILQVWEGTVRLPPPGQFFPQVGIVCILLGSCYASGLHELLNLLAHCLGDTLYCGVSNYQLLSSKLFMAGLISQTWCLSRSHGPCIRRHPTPKVTMLAQDLPDLPHIILCVLNSRPWTEGNSASCQTIPLYRLHCRFAQCRQHPLSPPPAITSARSSSRCPHSTCCLRQKQTGHNAMSHLRARPRLQTRAATGWHAAPAGASVAAVRH